ncbi:MAG: hypothetical protein C0597_06820 [Marinilabiliales bacterium]|nr:MAG: hypothetical protein C0597_06820 [Marinilabiliales bacterium]
MKLNGMIYVYKFMKQLYNIMKILKFLFILILIINTSCRKNEIDNPIDDWFQDPPVEPMTQVIKTVVPVGYAASIVTMHMKGLKSSSVKVEKQKSATVLYVDTNSDDYPFKFKNDTYGQLLVAYVQTDENSALVSVFFTDLDVTAGSFKLENIIAFPIIYDELEDKTTAVYASIDININSVSGYGLDLTETEVDENLGKLNNDRVYNTTDTDIAIAQNAWIIDVYHNGTFDDAYDDNFKIYGGQQAVEVQDFDTESSTGALHMAMIDVTFSADCIKNPTN